jgi:hypothetical protein
MKIILTVTTVLLIAGCKPADSQLSPTAPIPEIPLKSLQGKPSSAVVVDALVAALSQGSLEDYRSCLHPKTAEVPEYGSEEAMRFWKKQFDDLKAGGFTGNWRFKEVQASEASPRLPAGSMKAYPVVGDREISEYLLLILVDGEWRVLRIFS